MNMKKPPLYLLESFLAFGKSATVEKAASQLGISQPALSSHRPNLQNYFPQQLYSQEGRKKTLTPFGQMMFKNLEVKLNDLELTLEELTEEFEDISKRKIRIAGRHEILQRLASKLKFEGSLEYISVDSQEAVKGLEEKKWDFAISLSEKAAAHLHRKKVYVDQSVLLVPQAWNIKEEKVSKSLLKILLNENYLGYHSFDANTHNLFKHYDLEFSQSAYRRFQDWPSLIDMVSKKWGWAIAPTVYGTNENVTSVAISKEILPETLFYIYYKSDAKNQPALKALLLNIESILNFH